MRRGTVFQKTLRTEFFGTDFCVVATHSFSMKVVARWYTHGQVHNNEIDSNGQ